ncbi:YncE family protein [Marinimicrobium alkaliphilum]|uniref:YncE family protein n=1 Tax=Marinimicrobium alkaliphilum TaxID=2202654 RepID=UPI000DB9EBA5|nr:hypothetical protein [Marinimicrobium alkaliphilum]
MNIRPQILPFVLSAVLLVGCGSSSTGSPETPPTGSADSQSALVELHFPWRNSGLASESIHFRGEVSGMRDGYKLLIDGNVVTALTRQSVASRTHSSGDERLPSGVVSQSTYRFEWTLSDVAPDVGQYRLQVVDREGNPVSSETVVNIGQTAIPSIFDFDPVNRRLIGFSGTDLIVLAIETGEFYRKATLDGLPLESCHKRDTDEVYVIETGFDPGDPDEAIYTFRRVGLSSDTEPHIFFTHPRGDLNRWHVAALCHPTRNSLYVVSSDNFFTDQKPTYSVVYELDLDALEGSVWRELYRGEPWGEGGIRFADAILGEDHIYLYTYGGDGVVGVSYSDGTLTSFVPGYENSPTHLAQGSGADTFYAVNFSGVDILERNSSQSRRISNSTEAQGDFAFSQVISAAFDAEENRLLVGDEGLNMIMGIDLETGHREAVFAPGIGSGPRIVLPTAVAFDASFETAFILDGGGNTGEKILHIDMNTGNRRILADLKIDGFNRGTDGLALDESAGWLYAVRGDSILKVDIETGSVETIKSAFHGIGGSYGNISALALDRDEQRLYFSSPLHPESGEEEGGAIYAIDLSSDDYHHTLISKAGLQGTGPGFQTLNGLVLPSGGDTLYTVDQYNGNLYRVDIVTGNRSKLQTSCAGQGLGENETTQSLSLSSDEKALLLTWDGVTMIDRESGRCLDHYHDMMTRGYTPAPGTSFFSREQGRLMLVDPGTLHKVIVSQ